MQISEAQQLVKSMKKSGLSQPNTDDIVKGIKILTENK